MEDLVGYVHRLSPTKRSKRKSLPYFDFKLQTENEEYQRVVCFNDKLRSSLDNYQRANIPVKIRNASRSKSLIDDENNFLLNKRSRIEEANNSEVQFDAVPLPEPPIQVVQVSDIATIEVETKVHIRALLTKNNEEVRLVRNVGGQNVQMNDCCYLTDYTGKAIHPFLFSRINTILYPWFWKNTLQKLITHLYTTEHKLRELSLFLPTVELSLRLMSVFLSFSINTK